MENAQSKRKHFRFPAYDDELGVKLPSENERILFQDELVKQPMSSRTVEAVQPAKQKKTEVTGDNNLTKEQQTQLERHRSNLPDYTAHNRESNVAPKKKQNLFGTNPSGGWTQTFKKKETTTTKSALTTRQIPSHDSSYFVPKYIPASVIPEEVEAGPVFSEEELLQAMKKDQSSYLVMDNEPAAFQVKQDEDEATVKKFNIPSEAPEIPLTRRQYQKIKPDMERFGDSSTLPLSRKELKSAKKNAKNQTAYGKKVAEATQEKEKKRGILDKSLSGIIEDSSTELENSKYFS